MYYSGYSGMGPQRTWAPESFGLARMAAFGWLLKFEQEDKSHAEDKASGDGKAGGSFVDSIAKAASEKSPERDAIYDWLYVEQLRSNYDSVFRMAKQLAEDGGKEEQRFYLSSMRLRTINGQSQGAMRSTTQSAKKKPLSEEELDLMLKCYESLAADDPNAESLARSYGSQVAYGSNGQMYVSVGGNWIQVSGVWGGSMYLSPMLEELQAAGRDAKLKKLTGAVVARAKTAQQLASAMNLLFGQEKFEELAPLYPRWVAAAKEAVAKAPTPTSRQPIRQQQNADPLAHHANFLVNWIGKLGPDEEQAPILAILDPALDLSIDQAKKRRAARSTRAPSTGSQQQYYDTQFAMKFGKEQFSVRVDYPHPNLYVDQPTLMLLREVLEVFKRNDVLNDLAAHLGKRIAKASPDNLPYEQLLLGYVLWWTEEQDEAVQTLTAAAEHFQDDPAFRLETATFF